MAEYDLFRGVLGGEVPNVQEFDFGLGRIKHETTLDKNLLDADPAAFVKDNSAFLDQEELLIKQQTAQMQKQIADAEKERKINFTLKHDELKDDIAEQEAVMEEMHYENDALMSEMQGVASRLDKLVEDSALR